MDSNQTYSFLNDYTKGQIESLTKEYIQEYFVQKGYGKDKTEAIFDYITNCASSKLGYTEYLNKAEGIDEDNKVFQILANVDVFTTYDNIKKWHDRIFNHVKTYFEAKAAMVANDGVCPPENLKEIASIILDDAFIGITYQLPKSDILDIGLDFGYKSVKNQIMGLIDDVTKAKEYAELNNFSSQLAQYMRNTDSTTANRILMLFSDGSQSGNLNINPDQWSNIPDLPSVEDVLNLYKYCKNDTYCPDGKLPEYINIYLGWRIIEEQESPLREKGITDFDKLYTDIADFTKDAISGNISYEYDFGLTEEEKKIAGFWDELFQLKELPNSPQNNYKIASLQHLLDDPNSPINKPENYENDYFKVVDYWTKNGLDIALIPYPNTGNDTADSEIYKGLQEAYGVSLSDENFDEATGANKSLTNHMLGYIFNLMGNYISKYGIINDYLNPPQVYDTADTGAGAFSEDTVLPSESSESTWKKFAEAAASAALTRATNSLVITQTVTSPLVVDINGDGFTTLGQAHGTYFDLDNDGFAERTAWIGGGDDGFVVLDINGNGKIDGGIELFGNNTLLEDGTLAKDGFEALLQYDNNGDGKIDASDEIFNELRIWVDNGDGKSADGELHTLAEMGITSISVNQRDADIKRSYNIIFYNELYTEGVRYA
jgi:hypothetical protein